MQCLVNIDTWLGYLLIRNYLFNAMHVVLIDFVVNYWSIIFTTIHSMDDT